MMSECSVNKVFLEHSVFASNHSNVVKLRGDFHQCSVLSLQHMYISVAWDTGTNVGPLPILTFCSEHCNLTEDYVSRKRNVSIVANCIKLWCRLRHT